MELTEEELVTAALALDVHRNSLGRQLSSTSGPERDRTLHYMDVCLSASTKLKEEQTRRLKEQIG